MINMTTSFTDMPKTEVKIEKKLLGPGDAPEIADSISNLLQDELSEYLDEDLIDVLSLKIAHIFLGDSEIEVINVNSARETIVAQAITIQSLKEQILKLQGDPYDRIKSRKTKQFDKKEIPSYGSHLHEEKNHKGVDY